jgi:alkylation response protein AidB-like acyl-CoA dehydrogenase
MDFGLSEEQQLLQETLRRYLGENVPLARLREIAERSDGHDAELWQGLIELGIPGALIPVERGGSGLALLDAALIAQTLGWAATPAPFVGACVMAPMAFLTAGTSEQQREWLPRLAAGRARLGVAVTEVYARREESGVRLERGRLVGKALFALDSGAADGFLVAAGTRALLLVPADAEGLSVETLKTIDRTRRVAELSFDRVRPAEQLGGRRGAATAIARMLDAGRVALAADTLGACDRAIEMSVAYAKERRQFGRLIGSFQAVKHMCAEMVADIEPARSLLWYAAHAFDAVPEESRKMALLAKAHLSDVGTEVVRKATEVFGGIGFTDEGALHLWFKRVGLNRQLLGGPKQLRAQVDLGRSEARNEHPNPYL